MHVVATAGHVDHGKSTLVRALTGMEPDRWAEERRRGMTIDLGYAWLRLDSGEQVSFVDVPGHQRFIANMLAGLGPAPAVLLVIAADEGWRRQTSEHLDAVQALGIRHGLVAVTRSDLADPAPVVRDALTRLSGTSLADAAAVAVSGQTGQGLAELRSALETMLAGIPEPRRDGPVRLWIDRAFTVRGSGTVVTGTLGSGSIRHGQSLELNDRPVRVRALQQLGSPIDRAEAVARVAVNLRGIDRHQVRRGDCLLTPADWRWTDSVDVTLQAVQSELAGQVMVHVGTAAVAARLRRFSEDAARLLLHQQLPLRVGDRAVIRDPGQQVVAAGALVVDPDPPMLSRRGSAARRGAAIASGQAETLVHQVHRRGAIRARDLRALGVSLDESSEVLSRSEWLIDPDQWQHWLLELCRAVDEHAALDRQQPGISADAACHAIGLASPALLAPLVADAGLESVTGRILRPGTTSRMGPAESAIAELEQRWQSNPLDAPDRNELGRLGLGSKELATAAATGRLTRLAPDVVVAPHAVDHAIECLRTLPGPFRTSDARQLLAVSRRVAIPLLEKLDSLGLTERIDPVLRIVTTSGGHPASGAIRS